MKVKNMAALLLAGSVFLSGCAGGRVKSGVEVNGVEVGGMAYAEAAHAVRETLKDGYLPLTVHTPEGDICVSLDYSDDVDKILRTARKKGEYTAHVLRNWVNMEEEIAGICAKNAREDVNAEMTFSSDGFSYTEGKNGVVCDYFSLLSDATRALGEGGSEITLSCREVAPAVTVEALKARSRPLASFATRFDPANAPRSHNVALAASRISGTTVGAGEVFSFNEVVGKRTAENGFEEAAVILEGEFVQGVGGGVCQVSTTLFGAALRAGLTVVESRPHSLSVGYVQPSQDAMVSEYSDLKLQNPYQYPVFLQSVVENGTLSFTVFGLPDGNRYEVESRVLFTLDPPPAKIVDGTENRIVRAEKRGMASESWRSVYDGEGNLLSRTLVRRDTYACIQGIEERIVSPETILESEE